MEEAGSFRLGALPDAGMVLFGRVIPQVTNRGDPLSLWKNELRTEPLVQQRGFLQAGRFSSLSPGRDVGSFAQQAPRGKGDGGMTPNP
ncbi:MAG: hypothetical protein ACYDHG_09165 [Desulfomonilaceae bacterium]